jgi:hypothetical protein
MAVPIIDPTTSILVMERGKFFRFQPSVGIGSEAATGWEVAGTLPEGLELDAETGAISGTPGRESEGSLWVVHLIASNGSGDSEPVRLSLGIEYAEVEPDGALHAVIDLDTSAIGFMGQSQETPDHRQVVHCKSGDQFPLSITYARRKVSVDLPVTEIRVVCKETDPDDGISLQAEGDEVPVKEGDGDTARYTVWVQVTDEMIFNLVADRERPVGTAAPLLAEVQTKFLVDMGEEEMRTATRSSLSFWLVVHRDSIPS